MNRFIQSIGLMMLMTAFTVGCGGRGPAPDRAQVSGKINLKGAPYTGGGTVRFESKEDPKKYAAVTIHKDGTFVMQNAPLGPNFVAIENTSQGMMMDKKERSKFVPLKKWENPKTSKLESVVAPGENQVEFNLN